MIQNIWHVWKSARNLPSQYVVVNVCGSDHVKYHPPPAQEGILLSRGFVVLVSRWLNSVDHAIFQMVFGSQWNVNWYVVLFIRVTWVWWQFSTGHSSYGIFKVITPSFSFWLEPSISFSGERVCWLEKWLVLGLGFLGLSSFLCWYFG